MTERPPPTPDPSSSKAGSSLFSPKRQHTAFSATLLLMISSFLSAVLGLVRTKYIAFVFGAGRTTDAYNAAFQLPDMINYFLVGGVASITLVSILNRFREAGDDEGADRALSVVLFAMLAVLGTGILIAEVAAPLYTRAFFPNLDPSTSALCTHLTRILLPAQLFFFAGGVLGSRLLVRKIFLYQAVTPLVYNAGIILGGVLLAGRIGIDSLAVGVLAGALIGSTLISLVGALRSGLRLAPILDLRHPAFLEWLKLSLPLMVGVSLTMADKWILSYYASVDQGGITRLNVAKSLFNSPLSIIGMAAGAASLPFFSSLFAQGQMFEFNAAVNRAVSRLLAMALLVTAWMAALAVPILDLFRGGAFVHTEALSTARYFAIFSISLALWSAQGIYARAFYAARNTLIPAISGTVVTIVSIPVYRLLFHHLGVEGLAIASDVGILTHTAALAVLLHRRRLVSLATLDYRELARAAVAAAAAYAAVLAMVTYSPHIAGHAGDVVVILASSAVWALVCAAALRVMGSELLGELIRSRQVR